MGPRGPQRPQAQPGPARGSAVTLLTGTGPCVQRPRAITLADSSSPSPGDQTSEDFLGRVRVDSLPSAGSLGLLQPLVLSSWGSPVRPPHVTKS